MADGLADRRCVPCRGGTPPLTPEQIAPLLMQLQGWSIVEDYKLYKRFRLRNFSEAMDLANSVARIADEEGHHPDLYVAWGELRVYLWTHKIAGLTESDFIMAAKIDRVAGQLGLEEPPSP
ncbi:MAG: 4a-hydroxytetrahydrobiopterin dehydratase [Chthonomonadales bacterium]